MTKELIQEDALQGQQFHSLKRNKIFEGIRYGEILVNTDLALKRGQLKRGQLKGFRNQKLSYYQKANTLEEMTSAQFAWNKFKQDLK